MRFYLLCVSLLVIPIFVSSATTDFTRNLYIGMNGVDVLALQKFLNSDTETRVADTGAGSPGNETNYFGQATKRAVVRLQEKYRTDVLTPVGLSSGTGFFGEKTREKVSVIMGKTGATPPSAVFSKDTVVPVIEKGEVIVMFPSQYSGKKGTTITLSGEGFTPTDNTIYFGNEYAVVNASSWNGQLITFNVPNIPKGIYQIFLKNARGDSNKGTFFIITDGVTPEPQIDSVFPEIATRGGAVVIKGSGFLQNGNIIQYGAGVIKNVSSADGTTLSFFVPLDLLASTTSPFKKKILLPLGAVVINSNGVSNVKSYSLEI